MNQSGGMELSDKYNFIKSLRDSEDEEMRKYSRLYHIFLRSENIPPSCNCMNELKFHIFKNATERVRKGCKLSEYFLQIFEQKNLFVNSDWKSFLNESKNSLDGKNAIFYSLAGCCYLEGLGVNIDYKEAFGFFEKGQNAEPEEESCSFLLGRMYDFGHYVNKDPKVAFSLYQISEKKDFRSALNNLGILYEDGDGVEKNPKKALQYYMRSATLGHAVGYYNVGLAYQFGTEISKNLPKAFEMFESAAKQNYGDALLKVGYFYMFGWHGQKDFNLAKLNFEKSLSAGNVGAYCGLGQLFILASDMQRAVGCLKKGKECGDIDAIFELARIFEQDDTDNALTLYLQASTMENEGYALLRAACLVLQNDVGDKLTAKEMLKISAEQGQNFARRLLVEAYGEQMDVMGEMEDEEDEEDE